MHVLITSDTLNGIWTYRAVVSGLIGREAARDLVSFGEIPCRADGVDRLQGLEYHPRPFSWIGCRKGSRIFRMHPPTCVRW